ITVNTAAPTASGNQPPSKIFSEFALKNVKSTRQNSPTTAAAPAVFQRHSCRATEYIRKVVASMVPATEMPYAAARLLDDLKPSTSAMMQPSRNQFTHGR